MSQPPMHLRLIAVGDDAQRHSPRADSPADTRHATIGDPLQAIARDHTLQLELCEVLELIADGLPEVTQAPLAGLSAAILRQGFTGHMQLEEEWLFPLIARRAGIHGELAAVLTQLESEHDMDHAYGLELAEELEAMANGRAIPNAEMLGYMLRGFFTAQRRHIELENCFVLPLARRLLQRDDLTELARALAADTAPNRERQLLAEIRRARRHGDIEGMIETGGHTGDEACSGRCESCGCADDQIAIGMSIGTGISHTHDHTSDRGDDQRDAR